MKKAVKNSAVTSMENMGIYFKDEQKKERWESGQAILHRETCKDIENDKDDKVYEIKNSFGKLDYVKKDGKRGLDKEGLILEAFEAPGTPVHTEKEKHLNPSTMKKVNNNDRKKLYASEVPFHNQAFFYEMSGPKKSAVFLKNMKMLIHRQGHQTLQDAFGFLDQEAERTELKRMKECQNELLPEEFNRENKRMDALNSRLLRKEAKERQLCNELQVMLDMRTREVLGDGKVRQTQDESEKQRDDNFLRSRVQTKGEPLGSPETAEAEDEEDETL